MFGTENHPFDFTSEGNGMNRTVLLRRAVIEDAASSTVKVNEPPLTELDLTVKASAGRKAFRTTCNVPSTVKSRAVCCCACTQMHGGVFVRLCMRLCGGREARAPTMLLVLGKV